MPRFRFLGFREEAPGGGREGGVPGEREVRGQGGREEGGRFKGVEEGGSREWRKGGVKGEGRRGSKEGGAGGSTEEGLRGEGVQGGFQTGFERFQGFQIARSSRRTREMRKTAPPLREEQIEWNDNNSSSCGQQDSRT